MPDPPHDTDSAAAAPAAPAGPRPLQAGRTVHAFGYAFAGVGAACAVVLTVLLPALVYRSDAARDTRVLVGLAFALSWLSGFVGAAWAQAFPERRARRRVGTRFPVRAWRVRRVLARVRLVGLLLTPFATYTACAHLAVWLMQRQDPLYSYCERGLSRALAQPGIAAPTSLKVVEGRLTLLVPAYPARRARWWVDVDADDTTGRRCTLHSPVTFGEDPAVLHIPVPLTSEEVPERPFGLVPGSIVVVRGVQLTLDDSAAAGAAVGVAGPGPRRYERKLDMIYEVPAPRGARARAAADFVSQ